MIRTLLDAGLPMDGVRDVLVCTGQPADEPEACGAVFDRMRTVRDRLNDQAERIRSQVSALDAFLTPGPTPVRRPPRVA